MSLASRTVSNPAIDNLVQSSLEDENEDLRLEWIFCDNINIMPTQVNNVYYANNNNIVLVLLGNSEECTPTLVSEFARIYSLPTHKYNKDDNQFRRYSVWLKERNNLDKYNLNLRNNLIMGFTKYDDNYYMVADKRFYHCYS